MAAIRPGPRRRLGVPSEPRHPDRWVDWVDWVDPSASGSTGATGGPTRASDRCEMVGLNWPETPNWVVHQKAVEHRSWNARPSSAFRRNLAAHQGYRHCETRQPGDELVDHQNFVGVERRL
jgi:hypothetical protein